MKKIILFLVSIIIFANTNVYAKNPKKIHLDNHKIFRYDFDLRYSDLILTKALDDGKLGLENVLSCSKRNNAKAAFNAGFYHNGYRKTGIPSWLLITERNIFAINAVQDAIYITKNDEIFFEQITSSIYLSLENKTPISVSSINNPTTAGIQIYTDSFWNSTLTNPGTYEILVRDNHIIENSANGNTKIPENGFVISAHSKKDIKILQKLKKGDFINYKLDLFSGTKKLDINDISYLISGSNIIVKDSKSHEGFLTAKHKSDFRDGIHARTAICQLSKTKFAVFIVDHNQALNAYNVPVREMIIPLKKSGLTREMALKMPAGELLEKFNKTQETKDLSIGIDLPTFAEFLISQKCINAINMDGGGSSTLVVGHKVINTPAGLENVNIDGKNLRSIGDIFLVKKKSKRRNK